MITAKKILAEIGEPCLQLHPGKDYWYFAFDSGDVYETWSVYAVRLNQMGFDDWVNEGREFAAKMRARRDEMRSKTT